MGITQGTPSGGRSDEAAAPAAAVTQPQEAPDRDHDQRHADPAQNGIDGSPHQLIEGEDVGITSEEAGIPGERPEPEQNQQHAAKDQRAGQRDDQGREPQASDQGPLQQADQRANQQRRRDRAPPWPLGGDRLHELHRHDATDTGREARREIDLTQEQDEDLGHRQHHEHSTLLKEVDQVARREEEVVRADGGEDDGDEDQPQDHRKDATLARPQPGKPGSEPFAQGLGDDFRRDDDGRFGRGGRIDTRLRCFSSRHAAPCHSRPAPHDRGRRSSYTRPRSGDQKSRRGLPPPSGPDAGSRSDLQPRRHR